MHPVIQAAVRQGGGGADTVVVSATTTTPPVVVWAPGAPPAGFANRLLRPPGLNMQAEGTADLLHVVVLLVCRQPLDQGQQPVRRMMLDERGEQAVAVGRPHVAWQVCGQVAAQLDVP